MNQNEYVRGALSEINLQLTNLKERKRTLINETKKVKTEKDFSFIGGSYAGYLHMMENKREPITNPVVVYQGEPGAYSEMAAQRFFGEDVRAIGLHQFEDTFLALQRGEADYAVLPIENSSTGAIRQVYDLLEQYHYFFVGETTVRINHAIMALPGATLDDITTVYSHEQGLFQCEAYLNAHPQWKSVAQADTAGSAKMVAESGRLHKAAICSPSAAKIYGLEVLQENVNTNHRNTTRFIVISPQAELREERDKICISLTTNHNSGALHNVLTVFAVHDINMVRLESRPIPEHNWEYMFFIEFTGDLATSEMDSVIHEISLMASDLRVLGNFKSNL